MRLAVAAGICGTDVVFAGRRVSGFIYGHEFTGVTDAGHAYYVTRARIDAMYAFIMLAAAPLAAYIPEQRGWW